LKHFCQCIASQLPTLDKSSMDDALKLAHPYES
jgi:hypothetical protein